ncbi:MAG: hypothetical protein ACJAXJ_002731 [Colwellia sp.]|jgi:hypothetical protein
MGVAYYFMSRFYWDSGIKKDALGRLDSLMWSEFVTPNQRHDGLDIKILAKRKVLYQQKRNEHPERWSKEEGNWETIGAVELNPEQHKEAA